MQVLSGRTAMAVTLEKPEGGRSLGSLTFRKSCDHKWRSFHFSLDICY